MFPCQLIPPSNPYLLAMSIDIADTKIFARLKPMIGYYKSLFEPQFCGQSLLCLLPA